MECSLCNKSILNNDYVECSNCKNKFHLNCTDGKTRNGKNNYKCINCRLPENDTIMNMLSNIQGEVKKIDSICSQLTEMDKKFTANLVDVNDRLSVVERENVLLKGRLSSLEQRSRIDNVELSGVPFTKNENVSAILLKLATIIGFSLAPNDILIAHRVPTYISNAPPNIVAHLRDRRLRANFISKYKEFAKSTQHKRPCVHDFFNGNNYSRVYLNEHLCPEMKKLRGKVKSLADKSGFKMVWVDEGRIKVRKAPGSEVIIIRDELDLDKLQPRVSSSFISFN